MNDASKPGAVFVQTNEPTNAVIAFRRHADGGLERIGTHETGGAGSGDPHLPSQGSVTLTGDGRHLLVTNAAERRRERLPVVGDALELVGRTPAGPSPRSVAEHDGLVYALGHGEARHRRPAPDRRRAGADRRRRRRPSRRPTPTRPRSGSPPTARRSSSPIGPRTPSSRSRSEPTARRARLPSRWRRRAPTPYGFACTADGTLVVTEAFGAAKGAAAVSSYRLDGAAARHR